MVQDYHSYGMRKHQLMDLTKCIEELTLRLQNADNGFGDGVVIKASWCGGGGNCVKINISSSKYCLRTYVKICKHLKNWE